MATTKPTTEIVLDDEQPATSPIVDAASECVDVDQFDSRDGFRNWMATVDLVRDHLERVGRQHA
jgi:hypothetical protein